MGRLRGHAGAVRFGQPALVRRLAVRPGLHRGGVPAADRRRTSLQSVREFSRWRSRERAWSAVLPALCGPYAGAGGHETPGLRGDGRRPRGLGCGDRGGACSGSPWSSAQATKASDSMSDAVLYTPAENSIVVLTLNRPEARNPITDAETIAAILAALGRLEGDPDARVAI